jgi:hypothetical protein
MKNITDFTPISLDTEGELWKRFSATNHVGTYVLPGKEEELDAIIKEAHVVVERPNELMGLFVTSDTRFLWIARVLEGPHKGECCMADQDGNEDFLYFQR